MSRQSSHCRLPHPLSSDGITQESGKLRGEVRCITHLDGRPPLDKVRARLHEILHVGTEQNRPTVQGRLKQVVAASRYEAPSNKADAPHRVQRRQLTNSIYKDHLLWTISSLTQGAPTHCGQAMSGNHR